MSNIVLPFQVIEQVDEPSAEKPDDASMQGLLFDDRGRQLRGWTNKLIWGDNKLILSSLKNGPLRDEIEKQGGLKLIYIGPPFDVGADYRQWCEDLNRVQSGVEYGFVDVDQEDLESWKRDSESTSHSRTPSD